MRGDRATTNGDVTDLSAPLSHAALIAQRIEAPAQAGPVQADLSH